MESGEAGRSGAGGVSLFETRKARSNGVSYKVFAATIGVGILLIWVYRLVELPASSGGVDGGDGDGDGGGGRRRRLAWIGMFLAELCFGIYWSFTQAVRWNVVYRYPFKDRLLQRYENKLPGVDIFVCTADPKAEPPLLAINTILSAMAYNYPTTKLSVYLSDDGGSEFTFYAVLEASHFSRSWIPFCKKFNVEPRCPEAYFSRQFKSPAMEEHDDQEWLAMKKQYEDMKNRIESAIVNGSISKEIRNQHNGFLEWNDKITKHDHQPIVQIIIDGRKTDAVDNDGCRLPTLVYMAREKRPSVPHNFKAGAMNALIRVSSEISNGAVILNLDCDMHANNPDTIQETLCFFMDEETGHEIAYVQYPQCFSNITKNDFYANSATVIQQIELAGMDGYDAAIYIGTGCFHRRESLCGRKFSEDLKGEYLWETNKKNVEKTVEEMEEESKVLAGCSFEKGTPWGKEMGLVYGCLVEDMITGLSIQCRGWKSYYYLPDKAAFLGLAPNTLDLSLIQHKRWCQGMFQIFISKFCPFIFGHGKIKLGAQMGYCVYLSWALLSLPTFYYVMVPPLCLLKGIPLFPKVSSLWFIPFAYVFITKNAYSLLEAMSCKLTLKGWWNLQRILVIRRTTAYIFSFIETIIKQFGLSETIFDLTPKAVSQDVLKRYEKEVMEFESSSSMFIIIATLAMVNLFSFLKSFKIIIFRPQFDNLEKLASQFVLCGLMVMVNMPVYEALFVRKDNGRFPFSVMFKASVLASFACLCL
ncbi:cellulose synthase-like protein E6 isoform X1 [Carica papaya]|uniref:cellulose synthase-like protein E6 isoform X1 n=1 Tax=Carica papaya TaxID=3649 RepID=UPI000B8D0B16|nr:cellulose synthase-like protein E6 isoform X1 [Carica papaya]